MTESRLIGPVRVVGAGLLGTSVALGLRSRGIEVVLADASPTHVAIAVDLGAGRVAGPDDAPQLIVVAVPPDVTAVGGRRRARRVPRCDRDGRRQRQGRRSSTRSATSAPTSRATSAPTRWPAASAAARSPRAPTCSPGGRGSSRRTTPSRTSAPAPIDDLILDLGATLVEMTPEEHDRGVALISHVPQVVSSVMARRLHRRAERGAGPRGPGAARRDAHRRQRPRPLGADPRRERDAGARRAARRTATTSTGSSTRSPSPTAPGARRKVAEELAGGNTGVERLPGKHGTDKRFTTVVVMVDDRPGELARLLTEIGEIGVNLEDLRLEHSPGRQVGLAEISVLPEAADRLTNELAERGWRIAG